MGTQAIYFDGETAQDHIVLIQQVGNDIAFSGGAIPHTLWSIAGLHPIDPPTPGQPFRITHDAKPGARLIIRDQAFITALLAKNAHLNGGYSWQHLRQVFGWTVGGLVVLAALGWLTLSFLPAQIAGLLPQSIVDNAGKQVVASIVGSNKRCQTVEGQAAITAIVSALTEGASNLPPVAIEIYDMDLVNAFATPGGTIVLTRGLIQAADAPEEVAGVLAHEYGHVFHLHPEAQLVRISGLQIILSAVSGGASGDIVSSAAGLAALLQYSRDAEREADAFARSVLLASSINPLGLKTFFEKMQKLEGGTTPKDKEENLAFDRIGNIFSTHPGTEERIKEIQPLPEGQTPRQIMTDVQWQGLRKACN